MDKTQDTIMMMSYLPLLCGSLLAIAFLVVSLYTQQGKVIKSDRLKIEPSIEDKPDIKDERLASSSLPDIRYKKYYHDLPKEYCCEAMKEGVEDIEFIQYCQYYDEYSFSSYHGYPLRVMTYCPYCGKEIESLRTLRSIIQFNYLRESGWDIDEVDRYWDLFREGKSQEEAEKIVEQERIKSKSIPPM